MKPGKKKAIPVMIALKRARSSDRLLVVTSSIYIGALGSRGGSKVIFTLL